MVTGKHTTLQWEIPSLNAKAGLATKRCFTNWLGDIMPRNIRRGDVDKRGAEISHKCSRTFSSDVSPAHIHQGGNNQVNSFPDKQQGSIALSAENRRNRQQCTGKDQQGDLEYFNVQMYMITAEYL